ncbi:hypothetical protein C8J57DRAFT_1214398 [Mycena rebaudengoi]|nr:hypothetical protein C8J57DRAFT_1214398 [Mycena rebaudengoi]
MLTNTENRITEARLGAQNYLAECDISTLTWYRGPNGSAQLVTKEDVQIAEAALTIRRADPQGSHPEPPAPEPVVLSMIAHIPTYGFFMTSCGMWQESKNAPQTFAKAAGTLNAAAPNLRRLDEDFTAVLAKLLDLRSEGATQKDPRGILRSMGSKKDKSKDKSKEEYKEDNSCLKLRHVLFENTENLTPEERAERLKGALALGPAFVLENWPLPVYEKARAALKEMQATGNYIARPLVALDISDVPIPPGEYKRQLRDCVALIHFTLSRFSFPARDDDAAHDQFVADIERIHVLDEPYIVKYPSNPPSPSKPQRKITDFLPKVDSLGSPRKKARLDMKLCA